MTYDDLLTELDAWLNRSDLMARIPTYLQLFEARMNRLLRAPEMNCEFDYTTSAGNGTILLPSDFLSAREVYLDTDPTSVLSAMTPSALRNTYSSGTTGQPQAYAVIGTSLVLAPVPDGSYDLVLHYYQQIPSLSSDNQTNWLLTLHPDIYLWGTLCMASAHIRDGEAVAVWKQAWDEASSELLTQGNRQRLPSAPLVMQPTVAE